MKDSLVPLKDIIANVRKMLPFDFEDGKIWKIWEDTLGEGIAKNAKPLCIRNKILTVKVSGPVWMQELSFREKEIRDKLNKALGRDAIKKIRFKVG